VEESDILSFVVEQIRRFRPKVAIGHDLEGEYGHGMHMVYAEQLCKAVEISMNKSEFPESAAEYGVWDVPKTYLHLYPENPIVMDWDQPLESFDGMTAFEVTRDLGFPQHESQQTYYSWYFKGMQTSADITQYSPREFGLFRSTVGTDAQKNDFLENITTYAEQERLEQERLEQERLEQERLEQERLEQERLEQERLEQERLEQERLEQERLEQERLEKEQQEQNQSSQKGLTQQQKKALIPAAILLALLLIVLAAALKRLSKQKRAKK
jgi:hypothetical protein